MTERFESNPDLIKDESLGVSSHPNRGFDCYYGRIRIKSAPKGSGVERFGWNKRFILGFCKWYIEVCDWSCAESIAVEA